MWMAHSALGVLICGPQRHGWIRPVSRRGRRWPRAHDTASRTHLCRPIIPSPNSSDWTCAVFSNSWLKSNWSSETANFFRSLTRTVELLWALFRVLNVIFHFWQRRGLQHERQDLQLVNLLKAAPSTKVKGRNCHHSLMKNTWVAMATEGYRSTCIVFQYHALKQVVSSCVNPARRFGSYVDIDLLCIPTGSVYNIFWMQN
jgi:hypothetical protein